MEALALRKFVSQRMPGDGRTLPLGWGGVLDDHCWPCPDENVPFIDGDENARGLELEETCDRIRDLPYACEVSSDQLS